MATPPSWPLDERLPPRPVLADEALDLFLGWANGAHGALYPAQEDAILALYSGSSVILETPTGSGKSLVAVALAFKALAEGKRFVWTCPIKALVSEKFFDLCRLFGPEKVGLATGDGSVNRDAPITVCTAEVLSNMLLADGDRGDIDAVCMDEFHYYGDRERGVAWQLPLLVAPRVQYLLMSATLGDTTRIASDLETRGERTVAHVLGTHRPVPLDWRYSEVPLHEQILELCRTSESPIYLVCFSQRACAEQAQKLLSLDLVGKDTRKRIAEHLETVRFDSPYGKELARVLRQGVGMHHAGLLPKYRLLVEKLAQDGLLAVVCGTDTLGVGVNVPIRSVVFTQLCKYDGDKMRILSAREFHQIAGRAGRRGHDTRGTVVVQAPEHVIENLRLELKAGDDPVKKKRIVRKKPPEFGYAHFDRGTFDKLVAARPEPLVSRFKPSVPMIVTALRGPSGTASLRRALRTCHETSGARKRHRKHTMALLRGLRQAGIVQFAHIDDALTLVVDRSFQDDFGLLQNLGMFVVDAIGKLDRESPSYALDAISIVEAAIENPGSLMDRRLDKARGDKLAELKQAGVDYDARMAALDEVRADPPNIEFLESTFADFLERQPWAKGETLRPKHLARQVLEEFHTFSSYVKWLGAQRAEGLLLRYLAEVFKTLAQGVPDAAKNDELFAFERDLEALVRSVDASLFDEWERLRSGEPAPVVASTEAQDAAEQAERTDRARLLRLRSDVWRVLMAIARDDRDAVLERLCGGSETNAERDAHLEAIFALGFSTTTQARQPGFFHLDRSATPWRIAQTLVDDEGEGLLVVHFEADPAAIDVGDAPVLRLTAIDG
jgi:superfamily II RNA helicase